MLALLSYVADTTSPMTATVAADLFISAAAVVVVAHLGATLQHTSNMRCTRVWPDIPDSTIFPSPSALCWDLTPCGLTPSGPTPGNLDPLELTPWD